MYVYVLTLGKLIQIMIKDSCYNTCSATMSTQYLIIAPRSSASCHHVVTN